MTRLRPVSAHASATMAKSRSACAVLVWKNEFAEIWKSTPSRRLRDRVAAAEEVLFGADGDGGALGVDVQEHARRRRHARAQVLRDRRERLDVGRRRDEVHHRLPGPAAFAERHESQQPAPSAVGGRFVGAESARARPPSRVSASSVFIVSDCRRQRSMSRTTSYRSASCSPSAGPAARRRHRELHLVAIAVGLGRRNDRPQLERRKAAQALETVADLLLLERELRRIREVLQAAAAAASEVRARRVDAIAATASRSPRSPRGRSERALRRRGPSGGRPGSPPRTNITYPSTRPTPSPPNARSSMESSDGVASTGFCHNSAEYKGRFSTSQFAAVATARRGGEYDSDS